MNQSTSNYLRCRRKSASGQSIAVALIALAFLTLIGATVMVSLFRESKMARREEVRTAAYYIANAGIAAAERLLLDDKTPWDGLTDSWSANAKTACNITLNGGRCDTASPGACGVVDEESKFNINTADVAAFGRLSADFTPAIAEAIVAYRAIQPFRSVKELLMVPGVSAQFLNAPRDGASTSLDALLTVFGSGKVNVNTAPASVLAAQGELSPTDVEKIMKLRYQSQEIKGLPEAQELLGLSAGQFAKFQNQFTVSSEYFTIRANGRIDGRMVNAVSEIAQVVHRDAHGITPVQFEQIQ